MRIVPNTLRLRAHSVPHIATIFYGPPAGTCGFMLGGVFVDQDERLCTWEYFLVLQTRTSVLPMLALQQQQQPLLQPLRRLLIRPITSFVQSSLNHPSRHPSRIRSITIPVSFTTFTARESNALRDLLWKAEGIRYALLDYPRSSDGDSSQHTEPTQYLPVQRKEGRNLRLVFFTPELAQSATQELLPKLAALNLTVEHGLDLRLDLTRDSPPPSNTLVFQLHRKTDGPATAGSKVGNPGLECILSIRLGGSSFSSDGPAARRKLRIRNPRYQSRSFAQKQV